MKKIRIVFGDQSYILGSDEFLTINDNFVIVHGCFDNQNMKFMLPIEFLTDVVIFEDLEDK